MTKVFIEPMFIGRCQKTSTNSLTSLRLAAVVGIKDSCYSCNKLKRFNICDIQTLFALESFES
jgi:hypothetical protein